MTWYTYEISPIDTGWENLRSVQDTISEISKQLKNSNPSNRVDLSELKMFIANWESARIAAQSRGWEGDFRHDPVVFWIPAENEFQYGFVFKQDNNGTTYVVSPVSMSWLDEMDF